MNPVIRAHLVLEGPTEKIVLEKISLKLNVDLASSHIEIYVLEGAGKLKPAHLRLLLWHPYASSSSVAVAMSTPAPNGGVSVFDYRTDATRNLTFPWSMSGAFYPGGVTPVSSPAGTFLYTLSPDGVGVDGSVTYGDQDLQIAVSGLLDVPGFSNFDAINLTVPLTQVGFASNQTVGVDYGAFLAGTNLSAFVFVSHVTGSGFVRSQGPPWAKFLYSADLSNSAFLNVSKPHAVAPVWQLPWSAPIDGGYLELVAPGVFLSVLPGPQPGNIQLYDATRGVSKNFTAPGRYVVWHQVRGNYLYLLMDNTDNGTAYDYLLNRIDLSAVGDFSWIYLNPVQTLWERIFQRPIANDYAAPVVHGDRVDVFDGINGYVGYDTPHLNTVYELDFLSGSLLSQTDVNSQVGLVNGQMYSIDYPKLGALPLFNGYVADLDNRLVYPVDLSALEPSCSSCISSVYLTRYEFPVMDLLVEQQASLGNFASTSVSNLTVVEVGANYTLPNVTTPSRGTESSGELLDPVVFAVAVLVVASAVYVAVLGVAFRQRPNKPEGKPVPRSYDGSCPDCGSSVGASDGSCQSCGKTLR